MITKEVYTAALTVVEAYHSQLAGTIREIDKHHSVSLKSFMDNVEMSPRLRAALQSILRQFENIRLAEVMLTDIGLVNNVGPKTYEEFSKLRQLYLYDSRPK